VGKCELIVLYTLHVLCFYVFRGGRDAFNTQGSAPVCTWEAHELELSYKGRGIDLP